MRLITELIDGSYYVDIVFSPSELIAMQAGEMISSISQIGYDRFYIGTRKDERLGYFKSMEWEDDAFIEENNF